MDEIIYLEPDEEITSVIDKIKNAKATKLGLVIPREATLLQSVVNLRLLSREAKTLGKEIAVVTTDKIGRNLAAQVGLPVYNSIEEQTPLYQPPPPTPVNDEVIELDQGAKQGAGEAAAAQAEAAGVNVAHYQEKPVKWRPREKPIFKPNVGAASKNMSSGTVKAILSKKSTDYKRFHKLIWPLVTVFVILCLLVTYFVLPKAKVTISVPASDLVKQSTVAVSTQATAPNADFTVLPGKLIESSAQKQGQFPATGMENIGTKASGTITLYNSLDSNIHTINAGAKLSSSSKTFLTQQTVKIPGATVQSGNTVPGTVNVDIQAEAAGAEYNIGAGRFTIVGLPANQQEFIYGQSSKAMSGGLTKQVQVVSQQDYDNAKNSLSGELQATTKEDLKKQAKGQDLLDQAIITPTPQITTTSGVGQPASQFNMTINFKQQAIIFAFDGLKNLIIQSLQKQVGADQMVSIANDSDIGLAVTQAAYDKGELDLTANTTAKVSGKVDPAQIKTNVVGKTANATKDYISKINGVSGVDVSFKPSWWFRRLPYLSRNVNVQIQYIEIKK